MRKAILAIALLLAACDQNWAQAGDDGPAPVAPDLEVPAYDDAEDGNEKHSGGYHITSGTGTSIPGVTNYADQCGSGYYSYNCWWRWAEYGTRRLIYNFSATTWTGDRIFYLWCSHISNSNPQFAANTAQLCTPGHCVDVSNRVNSSNGCRSGSVSNAELPLSIGPGQTKHIDIIVRLQDGWIPSPQGSVGLEAAPWWYRD